jgi:hypothetical protein
MHAYPYKYAVFGCIELRLRISLLELNARIRLFGCSWYSGLETTANSMPTPAAVSARTSEYGAWDLHIRLEFAAGPRPRIPLVPFVPNETETRARGLALVLP